MTAQSRVFSLSAEISDSSKNILADLRRLQDSSIEMNESIVEMQVGAQKINKTG